jgi:hypothetical protein
VPPDPGPGILGLQRVQDRLIDDLAAQRDLAQSAAIEAAVHQQAAPERRGAGQGVDGVP